MFGLRARRESTKRTNSGAPAHSTTIEAKTSSTHLPQAGACSVEKCGIMAISITGKARAALIQKRRCTWAISARA